MKKILIITLIILSKNIFSQIPTYQWTYSIGDVSQEYLDALVTDSENNIIIAGQMYSTTDMDPTEFSEILYQVGLQDAYIEKFDEDGNVVWGLNFGGDNYDGIVRLAVDASDNIYAVGYFLGEADLDPDIVDQVIITSHGGYDMFLVKFNKEGEIVWGQGFGGPEDDWINNITIDDAGNIYITGQFKGTVDFDGTAAGVLEINSTLDLYDGFLAKYNTDGEVSWAFRMGGFYDDLAHEVAVDNEGNIIVTGAFQGTADFQGTFLDAAGGEMLGWPKESDPFIAKYNSDAELIWAKSIFGDTESNSGYSNMIYALALDDANSIYVTGLIYGKGDFDMNDGEHILTTFDTYDSFFAKYNSDGNLSWAHATAPKVLGYNLDMAIDAHNDIYLSGDFNYSTGIPYEADFDFDEDSMYTLQAIGEKDVYIAKYDSSAELIWAYNLGGSGWEYATAIALDNNFNICAGGWFYNSNDFDANPDSNFIWLPYTSPSYGNNVWIGKYHQEGIASVSVDEIDAKQQFLIYPNPGTDIINIDFSNPHNSLLLTTIQIQDIAGKTIRSIPFSNEIRIPDLMPGIYFIRIDNSTQKFIKQ